MVNLVMKLTNSPLILVGFLIATPTLSFAQKEAPENWFNLDYQKDNTRGVSSERAYEELLKDKKSTEIVVAVIDAGVDIHHEDLQGKIWVNEDEIPNNGIDDDKNGYIDDVNGWNFIGGKDGKNVDKDNLEMTRYYVTLSKKFDGKEKGDVSKEDKDLYKKYLELKEEITEKKTHYENELRGMTAFKSMLEQTEKSIAKELKKDEVTAEDLKNYQVEDEKKMKMVKTLAALKESNGMDEIDGYISYLEDNVNYYYNTELDTREIVGDNYENVSEMYYGNNDVKGPFSDHGTHVAGIIAANRHNDIGMKGVSENVKIMVLRTIPNGDERDKDVANSVFYAVDNGAQIINMSFGKSYSPYKSRVDSAFAYAESKGVLLVHAAGNEHKNIDKVKNFPNDQPIDGGAKFSTWIEVGASHHGDDEHFVGNFSNYGANNVDIFAPGVHIYSTMPENKYESMNGTSMACPVVSGVAALIWSYYPELTAQELKEILLSSAVNYSNKKINMPGTKKHKGEEESYKMVKFAKLSGTGSIVNAYEGLKKAESMSKGS